MAWQYASLQGDQRPALHLDNKKEGYERNPTGERCNVTAYADDLVLLITGKFLPTISELMENALGLTLRWAEKNGLGANPQKTEFVLFTRKTKIESFRLPTLGGTQLKLSKEAKYLGVILDSKLSWK
ncbi:hypothetical protein ACLKA6_010086 [Drosophila palustris]